MILFSKIEDIFRLTGYGFFVVPGAIEAGARLKAKDLIQLRTRDGRILNTQVAAVEFMKGARVQRSISRFAWHPMSGNPWAPRFGLLTTSSFDITHNLRR